MPNISDINYENISDNNDDELPITIENIPEISEDTIYNILFRNDLD